MYRINVDETYNPLKTIHIDLIDRPVNWQSKIISLQKYYLEQRDDSEPKNINDTINFLIILSYSYKLITDLEDEYSDALAWNAMSLGQIHQLFYDADITEAFCNEVGSSIVVTHRKYGRCLTNIVFTQEFWDALKIRAEYETGASITAITPALKLSLQSHLGNMRISLQIPPLTPSSPSFNIRRLPSKPILLPELIEQGQISDNFAKILEEKINERNNIIVAGEPGSGKTTLANALLNLSDPHWRLIIMEDAREVVISSDNFPMATRFFMPSVGDNERYTKRADEIARLLHRSPDYVFLGELQNAEDSKVAFEGFSAGIRGMATTHARSLDGLLSRWVHSHLMEDGLLSSIDVIVFTKRELTKGISKLTTPHLYIRMDSTFIEVV